MKIKIRNSLIYLKKTKFKLKIIQMNKNKIEMIMLLITKLVAVIFNINNKILKIMMKI